MQIVIDLEDECIKKIEKVRFLIGGKEDIQLQNHVINAIKHGIPLPKGHGRLIDADALGEKEECYLNEDESISFFYVYSEDIIYAPTIVEADKEE